MSKVLSAPGRRHFASEEFYRLLDGVMIDDTKLFNAKLAEWEAFYHYQVADLLAEFEADASLPEFASRIVQAHDTVSKTTSGLPRREEDHRPQPGTWPSTRRTGCWPCWSRPPEPATRPGRNS